MMQLFGGKDDFVVALDSIFSSDLKLEGELSDITGLIGQYVHGNEPSHHIAYLYDYVGQPWKTQELTRRLLREMYAPLPKASSVTKIAGRCRHGISFQVWASIPCVPVAMNLH